MTGPASLPSEPPDFQPLQEELALAAGVTRQTISAVENHQYVPSAQLAFLLALCLGKQVTEVFYLEEVATHA